MCALAHLALRFGWVTSGECEGVVALFFSEFTIPVAQKASWLLGFGTGVLLSCVAWDISRSGCFYTVQDLLGRPARTRRCLGSLALFLSRRFCILLYYDLLQAGLGERSWRHYRVYAGSGLRSHFPLGLCRYIFVLCTCAPVNETLLDASRYQTCLRAQNYST